MPKSAFPVIHRQDRNKVPEGSSNVNLTVNALAYSGQIGNKGRKKRKSSSSGENLSGIFFRAGFGEFL